MRRQTIFKPQQRPTDIFAFEKNANLKLVGWKGDFQLVAEEWCGGTTIPPAGKGMWEADKHSGDETNSEKMQ